MLDAPAIATLFHLFVVLHEEHHLRRAFGAECARHRARVPRWIARILRRSVEEENPDRVDA